MKPKQVKKLLVSEIRRIADNHQSYCTNPKSDFTRNRKLPLERLLTGIIGMGSASLSNELLDMLNCSANAASFSAFIQQRNKISPKAFESMFKSFSKNISADFRENMRVLAVDRSKIPFALVIADRGYESYNNMAHIQEKG